MRKKKMQNKTVKPSPKLLDNIIQNIRNLDTPEKQQKELVRLVVKYYLMEYEPGLYQTFESRFGDIYDSLTKPPLDIAREEEIKEAAPLDTTEDVSAKSSFPDRITQVISLTDRFISALSSSQTPDNLAKIFIQADEDEQLVTSLGKIISKLLPNEK